VGDESDSRIGVDYLLGVWMRRKWVALLVFAAGVAAIVSFTVWLPDLYSAKTTVIVETQQVSQEFVRSAVSAGLESRIQRIQQELMSRDRLADLVTQLNLYPELRQKGAGLDAMIERFRRDIRMDPTAVDQQGFGGNRTIAFTISYSGRDPQLVAQVANVVAGLYVVQNSEMREGQAMRTAEFLKQQLAGIKQELDAQDRRLTEFNMSHIGELPQQAAANLASLERLNTQLRLNGDNQMRATDRRERYQRQLVDAESATLAAPVATTGNMTGAEQVAALRRQLDELRRKYTEQYPEVIRVRTELATLERQLAERSGAAGTAVSAATTGDSADPRKRLLQAIEETDTELKALKDEELAFRRAISSYEQRVENGPKRDEEFQALTRDYQSTKERYDSMLKRHEEAQLASTLEQGQSVEQFRILEAAIPPRDPSAPNRLRFLLVGLVLSLGMAVAAVLLVEKLDTTFHGLDELREFVTVPALFSIPRVVTSDHARRQWRRIALTAVSVVVGLVLIVAGSRYIASNNERIARVIPRGQM
jgi:polysaccharide chain length determinant protein (PEP-CTERM system associated)